MNKKNILNLSVMGAMGIASASVANAQSKTFYQCFPISCKMGQFASGSTCQDCSSDYWCPDGKEKTYLGTSAVRNKILNMYKTKLLNKCKEEANVIFFDKYLKIGGNPATRQFLIDAFKSIKVKVDYNGNVLSSVAGGPVYNKIDGNYNSVKISQYFEFSCVNITGFTTVGIKDINDKLASGIRHDNLKNNPNKNLYSLTDTEVMSIIGNQSATKTITNVGSSSGSLNDGLYAVVVEGAGGGGGGGKGPNCSQVGGRGGWGQAKMGEFLVLGSMSYNVSVGASGYGGHNGGSRGDSGGSSSFISSILNVNAEGGNGGEGANDCWGNNRGNAKAKDGVVSDGNTCGGGSRDGSQTEIRLPGCGDKGNEWGSGGGKGRVRIYQIN